MKRYFVILTDPRNGEHSRPWDGGACREELGFIRRQRERRKCGQESLSWVPREKNGQGRLVG